MDTTRKPNQIIDVTFVPPTIGRTVHYTNLGDKDGKYPPETQAAIITGVNEDGSVSLKILYRTGIFDMPSVPFSTDPGVRGHWTYIREQ